MILNILKEKATKIKVNNVNKTDEDNNIEIAELKTALLTISPGDELMFNITDSKQDITQYIKLTNISSSFLAYKVIIIWRGEFKNTKFLTNLSFF